MVFRTVVTFFSYTPLVEEEFKEKAVIYALSYLFLEYCSCTHHTSGRNKSKFL